MIWLRVPPPLVGATTLIVSLWLITSSSSSLSCSASCSSSPRGFAIDRLAGVPARSGRQEPARCGGPALAAQPAVYAQGALRGDREGGGRPVGGGGGGVRVDV